MDLANEIELICSAPYQEIDKYLTNHDLALESAIELSRRPEQHLSILAAEDIDQILGDFMDDDGVHLREQLNGVEGVLVQVMGKDELIHSFSRDDVGICVYTVTKALSPSGGKTYSIDFQDGAWILMAEGDWLS